MSTVADTTTVGRTIIVRALSDGQLVIPTEFRQALGLDGDAVVAMTIVEGEVRIREATESEKSTLGVGSDWFKELYDYFAPAREEAIAKGYTEQEINEWIDQAVAEVRAERGRG